MITSPEICSANLTCRHSPALCCSAHAPAHGSQAGGQTCPWFSGVWLFQIFLGTNWLEPVLDELWRGTPCKPPQLLAIPELHPLLPGLGQVWIWKKIPNSEIFQNGCWIEPVQLAHNEVGHQAGPGGFTFEVEVPTMKLLPFSKCCSWTLCKVVSVGVREQKSLS